MSQKTLNDDINRIISDENLFESFRGSKILVTGATGLIGSEIMRSLAAANDKYNLNLCIIGQARSKDKVQSVLGDISKREDVEIIYDEQLNFDVQCDYIIHTLCPTASKFFVEHPVETIDISLSSTKKMLGLAKKNSVKKMIYISSMEEYGVPYENGQVMTEDKCGIIDHLSVRSCYPESKRMCECYCVSYASEYGVNVSIARLAQTFGAGVPLTDNRVFMQFARSAINKDNIILHTLGKSMSNFCYISDATEGIFRIMANGQSGEAYNVCNDVETRSIADIAKLVAEKIANNEITVEFDIPESAMKYGYAPDVTMRLCSDKLKALGWFPKVSMEEAYRKLIAYLQENE